MSNLRRDYAALQQRLGLDQQYSATIGETVVPVALYDNLTPLVEPLRGPLAFGHVRQLAVVGGHGGFAVENRGNGARVMWAHSMTSSQNFGVYLRPRAAYAPAPGIVSLTGVVLGEGEPFVDTFVSAIVLDNFDPITDIGFPVVAADLSAPMIGRSMQVPDNGVWVPPGFMFAVVHQSANLTVDLVPIVYEHPRA